MAMHTANDPERPTWDRAAYPAAEAGRLVGLSPDRVRRWLRGYDYKYAAGVRHQEAVLKRRDVSYPTHASFLDLIDLLFVKRFVDHGFSLQRIRKALNEAVVILGTGHFARRSFFTEGRNIYLQVRERGDELLQLLSGGQWVIAPIIQELALQIDFDEPGGLARRWYPLGQNGLIVLDPMISFGRPTIAGRGIATANVFDLYNGEGKELEPVRKWLDLRTDEVRAAVTFEQRLAA